MSGLPVLAPGGGELERRCVEARDYLAGVATRASLQGLVVEKLVEVGDPADLVASVAHGEGVGLTVMATHGRTGLARLVMGSVTSAALQRAGSPVMLVRPGTLALPVEEAAAVLAPPKTAGHPLDLTEGDRALAAHGLELLEAATDRGTPEAARIEELIGLLEGRRRTKV